MKFSLHELQVLAHFELLNNETIRSYTMVDGKPVYQPAFEKREWKWPVA